VVATAPLTSIATFSTVEGMVSKGKSEKSFKTEPSTSRKTTSKPFFNHIISTARVSPFTKCPQIWLPAPSQPRQVTIRVEPGDIRSN
jgi:hypothetical protein